ncbi:hypothetical protein [Diaphorobacter sp.]|uniref:hypothetical protein n=1 Tax=Diaphorobacter sp. TaxID=1934310 RepID=UPI0025849B7C|nr:hypothetical protein [Diaphorobacter sp.]
MAYPTPTEESNPAARLSRLIAKAMRTNDSSKSALEAWGDALDIPTEGIGLECTHDIAQLLTECTEEVRLLKLALRHQGVPEALYSQHISHVEHALSVTNLNAAWSTTVSNYLGSNVLLSLAWCSYVLPNESVGATDDDLIGLAALLRELEDALQAPGLPEAVRAAFTKHLLGMQRAMKIFPVRGVKPMKEASRAILADLNIDKDEIRDAASTADRSAMGNLGNSLFKAWKKTAEIAGDADKIVKTGRQLVEFVSDAIDKLPA